MVLSSVFTSGALELDFCTIFAPVWDSDLLQVNSCIRHRPGQKCLAHFSNYLTVSYNVNCVFCVCSGLVLRRITQNFDCCIFQRWAGRKLDDSSPPPQVWDISRGPWQQIPESANYSCSVTVRQPRKLQFVLKWILNMSYQLARKRSILIEFILKKYYM